MAVLAFAASLFLPSALHASDEEQAVARVYLAAPPAPMSQTPEQVAEKSAGCYSCHTRTDEPTMHSSPAVMLGCVDCHGGNAGVIGDPARGFDDPDYVAARDRAHILPMYPKSWNFPDSANPKRSYTLLNREAPEFIRFVNPGDYRIVRESCGACHIEVIEKAERSIMASGAMLFGGAAYNNGIIPYKNYLFGEAYTRDGKPAKIVSPGTPPGTVTAAEKARGALAAMYPLPTWQVTPPGDVFRVFERGGRNVNTQFAEVGLPNPTGSIQRLEEPGRPDLKQSNRGPATGLRVAIPILNIHKTRLNDPLMWFMGTNDQPGDYRGSGCTGCHVIYANDREPRHSLIYAQYGRDGQSQTVDPTIAASAARDSHGGLVQPGVKPSGHPLKHSFTRAIPTAQCMSCHMHQPNIFLNSYLGYTMWDYEADAPKMWPEKQKYPTAAEQREILDRNPEAAAVRGKWGDFDFLRNAYDLNPELKDTQFADYHGHGWNFRGVFKRDREGNLLDAEGKIVWPDDPEKWRRKDQPKFAPVGTNPGKAVHLMDIHAEKGLQCADCHFAQDSHGNGLIQGEVANAVEIGCKDCHGTADAYPTLRTSGPAARPQGSDLTLLRNPDGQRRFEWIAEGGGRRKLVQRSIVDPSLEWTVHLVRDSVDPASPYFNAKAARAKLMSRSGADDGRFAFGPGVPMDDRAHRENDVACFTCHLSWTTSCGGCHLPIEANQKTKSHHYEGEETRNFATYNPQVARDDMFQ
ncbi:MAG: multiheme c-type cytochrome, partial [Pseudomonadota bacterium]